MEEKEQNTCSIGQRCTDATTTFIFGRSRIFGPKTLGLGTNSAADMFMALGHRCTNATTTFIFGRSRIFRLKTLGLRQNSAADIFMALAMLLTMAVTAAGALPSRVTMPNHYTAMKGDLVVAYQLDVNSTHLKSFNAMIHIEYLPGDAVLTNTATTTSTSIHLAR